MTIPRRIIPHTSWLITRRCSERRFFLLPGRDTAQVFEYALARAARITGVQLHAWMVMSNHYHLVVTDTQGRLPEFIRLLNSLVARALNFHYKRREAFWKPGSYSAVQLCTNAAIFDKMLYTLANPVVAGLVRKTSQWMGSSSYNMEFGTTRRVVKPWFVGNVFKSGQDAEELHLVAPPRDSTTTNVLEDLNKELWKREEATRQQFAAEGKRFLEMDGVWRQSWNDAPRTEEQPAGIIPRFAAKDPGVLRQVLHEWRAWLSAYRLALAAFREGVRDVEFPAGTYLMKERFDVVVAAY